MVSRSVKIGKGSIVRNSIIMQKSQIGDNCIIDGVIIDKDVKIGDGVVLKGNVDEPYVVEAFKTVRLKAILKVKL